MSSLYEKEKTKNKKLGGYHACLSLRAIHSSPDPCTRVIMHRIQSRLTRLGLLNASPCPAALACWPMKGPMLNRQKEIWIRRSRNDASASCRTLWGIPIVAASSLLWAKKLSLLGPNTIAQLRVCRPFGRRGGIAVARVSINGIVVNVILRDLVN